MGSTFDDKVSDDLIQIIYDAAFDDGLWVIIQIRICQLIGACACVMIGLPTNPKNQMVLLDSSIEPNAWKAYEAYYWQQDIWLQQTSKLGLNAQNPIIRVNRQIKQTGSEKTSVFCEFANPMKNIGEMITALLFVNFLAQPHLPPVVIAFYRPSYDESFAGEEEALIRYLLPHLQRSLHVRWMLACERELRKLREQALNHIGMALFLLDDKGIILYANLPAQAVLRGGGDPSCINGRLAGITANSNDMIVKAKKQALGGIGSSIRLPNAPPLETRVATFLPLYYSLDRLPPGQVLVLITAPEKPAYSNVETFAKLYRISPAEARVLQQLINLHNTREIAEKLHISMKTLRTQLSALFAKTNTRNQRELIQFFLAHPFGGEID